MNRSFRVYDKNTGTMYTEPCWDFFIGIDGRLYLHEAAIEHDITCGKYRVPIQRLYRRTYDDIYDDMTPICETKNYTNCVVMSATGFTDDAGKDIYEGDIFANSFGYTFVVDWNWLSSMFCAMCIQTADRITLGGSMTIIGNIWETPHLLETKQKHSPAGKKQERYSYG